jgi:peroxin-1
LFIKFVQSVSRGQALVIITAKDGESLAKPLLSSGNFVTASCTLQVPSTAGQVDAILGTFLSSNNGIKVDTRRIAEQCAGFGYTPRDLNILVQRALQHSAINGNNGPLDSDFQHAFTTFRPSRFSATKEKEVSWKSIGGLKNVKQVLSQTLLWPTRYASIFKQSPLRLRSGLLLYGYPGTGKTLLASAITSLVPSLTMIRVNGPELLNKYIGASERAVRDLFARASACAPSVIFFDEFESIAPKRGGDSTGVSDRVVNQLLTLMDGAEGLEGVYIVGATSRPDLIDGALLRPGRLDKSLEFGMPDVDERREVCSVKFIVDIEGDVRECKCR